MDSASRKIEIFAPFTAAFDLTKASLFQPFDLAKWFTIGFAAFLAWLADASRVNPGFRLPDFNARWQTQNDQLEAVRNQLDPWILVPLVGMLVVIGLALLVVVMWLGARGRFMFIDCIVWNRGAIQAPWREYRREGNSLFLWSLAVLGITLLLTGILALPVLLPYFTRGEFPEFGAGMMIYLIAFGAMLLVAGLAIAVVTWFMVPVMYRQRCSAPAAFGAVMRLITSDPAPFIFYILLALVTVIGAGILSCVATCLTCCLAAVPYIGTVLLLPLHVFHYGFGLLFLRQFGPEYDVWANVPVVEQASSAGEPPPVDPPPAEPPVATGPRSEPPPLPSNPPA